MTSFLSTMLPIFGLVLLGWVAVKARVMTEAGVRGLVLFVFNFAIPALLFGSLAEQEFPANLEWGFLGAYYAGALLSYGLGMAAARLAFGRALPEQAIYGMCASYSNLVMVGLPIVLFALGPEAMLPMMLIIAFQSVTFMPLTVALIQRGRHSGPGTAPPARIALELLKNPIVVSILLGLLANLVGFRPAGPVDGLLDLLGPAAIPCALFALGASLAGYSLAGAMGPVLVLGLVKLIVHPLVVWLIAVPLLGLDGIGVSVAILLAAMPSAVNTYLFGARYEVAEDVAARTVLLTTVCAAVSTAVVVAVLQS